MSIRIITMMTYAPSFNSRYRYCAELTQNKKYFGKFTNPNPEQFKLCFTNAFPDPGSFQFGQSLAVAQNSLNERVIRYRYPLGYTISNFASEYTLFRKKMREQQLGSVLSQNLASNPSAFLAATVILLRVLNTCWYENNRQT